MYITHYKEMGHQRDTMEDCFSKEGTGARLPLPDYVESAAILEEMRAVRQLEAAVRLGGREAASRVKGGWRGRSAVRGGGAGGSHGDGSGYSSGGGGGRRGRGRSHGFTPSALAAAPSQPHVLLMRQEQAPREVQDGAPACSPNVTFGGLRFDGRPYLWTARGCHGIFLCGDVTLRCGIFIYFDYKKMLAAHQAGRGWLRMCSCDATESLDAARHWRDGRDHAANNARSVTVEYRL